MKLLKDVKGFDNVGIGVIWCDEGEGTYIRCKDLEGYDLTGVQIYRYNSFFRTMSTVDKLQEDSENYVFCVKRSELSVPGCVNGLLPIEGFVNEFEEVRK